MTTAESNFRFRCSRTPGFNVKRPLAGTPFAALIVTATPAAFAPHSSALGLCYRMRLGAVLLGGLVVIALPSSADAQTTGAYQTYQYDSLGRLVGAWDSAGINSQAIYDPVNNRTATQVVIGSPPTAPIAPSASHGNQIFKTINGTQVVPY